MPNIQSAKKRVKVTKVKSLNNQIAKNQLRTQMKKFDAALAEDKEAAEKEYKATVTMVDKAVNKGILHKNNASRKKSALTKKLNSAE